MTCGGELTAVFRAVNMVAMVNISLAIFADFLCLLQLSRESESLLSFFFIVIK